MIKFSATEAIFISLVDIQKHDTTRKNPPIEPNAAL
jgi:hypothetical protein